MPSSAKARTTVAAHMRSKATKCAPPGGSTTTTTTGDGRARVDIHITNHYAAKIYTAGASITGEAVVRVPRDTHFDRIAVQFAGFTATRNYMTPEISQVLHHFLLLDMPDKAAHARLPPDRFLRAGQSYTLPFHFVVPERLPIGSCCHRCEHASVREHHLRLPPTMGACWGDRDDASPETARVQYCVSVSVLQRPVFMPEPVSILRGQHEVNVLPVGAEDAPLDIEPGDKTGEYRLAASKTLRKSLVSRKFGTVTVEAAQPSAVVLSPDARLASQTRIALRLRFSSAARGLGETSADAGPDEASLPAIHSITAKLIAKTYYNTSHMGAFPDRDRRTELNYGAALYYSDSSRATDLPFDLAGGWQAQKKHEGQPSAWAATVDAALQLPTDHKRVLLPTFHGCLLSRTYTLRLVLSVGPGRTNIALSLPLQIIVEGGLPAVPQPSPARDVLGHGGADASLPSYKDHLFIQNRCEDGFDTHLPAGIRIIM
ncbi:hypothetical protein V2A60_004314 [Cordyceps javanica]|uniref:Arrestin n=1 Tax=Cordyceps javanica TaxID=43265 RepID=A0A545URB0_9HYPO|nr:arrestin [Cordyceps javanica]TQW04208.1 arrestin [Cordyceps javanica]